MARLARFAASAVALLAMLSCSAAARELLQPRNLPYAPSLYACVVKAGLHDLQAALDAAGMKALLSNPRLKMTLVAPNDDGFKALYTDCQKPANVKPMNKSKYCSLQALLADKKGNAELMRYHLLPGIFEAKRGKAYFPLSSKFWKQETYGGPGKKGMIVRMRLWDGGYEIHGTGRDASILGSTKSGKATGANYICGGGIMHITGGTMTKNVQGL